MQGTCRNGERRRKQIGFTYQQTVSIDSPKVAEENEGKQGVVRQG